VRKFLGNKGVFSETFVLHTNRNLILFSIAHWLRCCFLFLSLESLRSSWSKLSEISWRYPERSSEKKTMKTFTVITTVVEFFGPFYDDCYLICCWNEHLFVCLYSSHFNSLQTITNLKKYLSKSKVLFRIVTPFLDQSKHNGCHYYYFRFCDGYKGCLKKPVIDTFSDDFF